MTTVEDDVVEKDSRKLLQQVLQRGIFNEPDSTAQVIAVLALSESDLFEQRRALDVLLAILEDDSRDETVKSAAIEGLAHFSDETEARDAVGDALRSRASREVLEAAVFAAIQMLEAIAEGGAIEAKRAKSIQAVAQALGRLGQVETSDDLPREIVEAVIQILCGSEER